MADVNKTVDISVKADMKQLLNQFKNMPGMTAKEAKKMVSQLEKEFKAAERAAKKAAATNAAAMKRMGNEAKNAAKDVQRLKKASREMGGALQATGDIVGQLDPALGGLVNTVSIAGVAIRDLGKALLTGNPYILAVVGAIAAAASAYAYFNQKTIELESSQKNVTTAINVANQSFEAQSNVALEVSRALSDHKNTVADLEMEYALLSGQISQYEADISKAKQQSKDMTYALTEQGVKQDEINKKAIKSQRDSIKVLKEHLAVTEEQGYKYKENGEYTDGYAKTLETIQKAEQKLSQLEQKRIDDQDKFIETAAIQQITYDDTMKKIIELKEQQRKQAEQDKKNAAWKSKQMQKQAKEAADNAKLIADLNKEEERILQLNAKIFDTGQQAKAEAEKTNIDNQRIKISMMDSELEKITANAQLEQDAIQKQIDLIQKQKEENLLLVEGYDQEKLAKEANLELDNQIAELKEQAHLKDMEAQEERLKAIDNEKKKRLELVESIVNQSIAGANAVSEIIKNVAGENKEAAMLAFRVNQAAAIANIAMTTAQKIMEVAPNPFAIAGVTALGIAQGAAVATQPPPEFHMGGVIDKGEDTRNITVLTGEAVLDRRTVQRLGGDAGISQLQRGKMPENKTVVMNPFKHFDRYVKASSQRGGIMNQFSNTKAAGSY